MAEDDFIRAGAAILRDLALFDRASRFFDEEVEPAVRTAVGDLLRDWIRHEAWQGETDCSEEFARVALWPSDWSEDDQLPFARFRFGERDATASNSYELADLFGAGQTEFGFRFTPEYSWFGGKSAWNAFARTLGSSIEALSQIGWIHEGKGVFFRVVPLTGTDLAAAWEAGDWSGVLAPLTVELERLAADKARFDAILMKAKPKR